MPPARKTNKKRRIPESIQRQANEAFAAMQRKRTEISIFYPRKFLDEFSEAVKSFVQRKFSDFATLRFPITSLKNFLTKEKTFQEELAKARDLCMKAGQMAQANELNEMLSKSLANSKPIQILVNKADIRVSMMGKPRRV